MKTSVEEKGGGSEVPVVLPPISRVGRNPASPEGDGLPENVMPERRIGVVVPTLNSGRTLSWTLCSLLGQKEVAVDVVVADSGSQDETLSICKMWGVPSIFVPPGNMYRAINAGLGRLDAEWVTYLNSDDIVFADSYSRLMALGERQDACLVYGDCDFVDGEGRFLFTVKSPPPSRLAGMVRFSPLHGGRVGFAQPAAIYRRAVYRELGGFDEQYRNIADYDFFYRLITSGRAVAKVSRPAVAAFRLHESQLSVRLAGNMWEEVKAFRSGVDIKVSPLDLFDVLSWRLRNSPTYMSRLLRLRP